MYAEAELMSSALFALGDFSPETPKKGLRGIDKGDGGKPG